VLACGAVLGVLLGAGTGLAQAAPGLGSGDAKPRAVTADGSTLLDETFAGSQVDDPGFIPLDSACLTGATTAPPGGVSQVGPCDGDDQTTAPVPVPGQTPGYLQLTDSGYYRKGGMLYNRPLPGNGGLQVTFDQYQYGTSPAGAGADGIGFFLVDGSTDLTSAGADGGSLGYAQRNLDPGVDGGYVGVGLDAYGNFVNDFENRGLGCPDSEKSPVTINATVPDTVTLRGPGQGDDGYCYLASTITADPSAPAGYRTTLPGSLREQGTDPAPARRTVRVTVSPDVRPTVTVEIDFHDGNGFRTVLSKQVDQDAPPTYKFGFSASTGGSFDTHLIGNVHADSVQKLDNLNLVKTVDSTDHTGPYNVGDTVHYQFLVTNTGTTSLSGVEVSDPAVDGIDCPSDTLGAAGTSSASMVCTGSHVLTEQDVAGGTFTNTATAHGTDTDGDGVDSNESSASVPVTPPVTTPDLQLDKQVSPRRAQAGDEVTYTVHATNNGDTAIDPATFTDDLTGVLDDGALVGDPAADTGTATVTGSTLAWSGTLAPGQTATITYSVRIDDPDQGDKVLRNAVTSAVPGAHCAAGAPLPCRTTVIVRPKPPHPRPTPCPPTHKPEPPHGYGH
jgi:uncharacterized repeat protein (TIGR01451 family)